MATNADVLASPVDYIQRVRALAPAFAAAQAHEETVGELDPRLVAEMHAAGLFRMVLSREGKTFATAAGGEGVVAFHLENDVEVAAHVGLVFDDENLLHADAGVAAPSGCGAD